MNVTATKYLKNIPLICLQSVLLLSNETPTGEASENDSAIKVDPKNNLLHEKESRHNK